MMNISKQEILNYGCIKLGLQEDIKVVSDDKFRWILSFTQDPKFPDFIRNMLKLERLLQDYTNHPIDLRLETESDRNKRVERTGRGE